MWMLYYIFSMGFQNSEYLYFLYHYFISLFMDPADVCFAIYNCNILIIISNIDCFEFYYFHLSVANNRYIFSFTMNTCKFINFIFKYIYSIISIKF